MNNPLLLRSTLNYNTQITNKPINQIILCSRLISFPEEYCNKKQKFRSVQKKPKLQIKRGGRGSKIKREEGPQ